MMIELPQGNRPGTTLEPAPMRVLLLDDEPANLYLRAIILRQHGFEILTAGSVEEAVAAFDRIDIAVLDYHLGAGQFGTDVATTLRRLRPEVSIIILSATLEYYFGGVEDMHLLKGYSSNEDLIAALKSLDAKRRGDPVVVDAREFFYSRIALAIGSDVLIQILDAEGNWVYCNETAAEFLAAQMSLEMEPPEDQEGIINGGTAPDRHWFAGRNMFHEMPGLMRDWRGVIANVAVTRQTYIDRSRRGLLAAATGMGPEEAWSVLAFPMTLHDGRSGVVLAARVLGRTTAFPV
jgi:CheY-like chemotaxis protein